MSDFPSELASPAGTTSVFRVVASLYLQEPSIELERPIKQYLAPYNRLANNLLRNDNLEILRQEYADLFFVPVSGRYLPPFESVQRKKRLWGPVTHKVAEIYQACHFKLQEVPASPLWQAQFVPDHIGYELAFVEALLQSRKAAPSSEACRELDETVQQFWRRHLSPWITSYGRELANKAQTGLYRYLGLLTEALGKEWERCLESTDGHKG
ncbi:MAG: molecular chaperone TorD family protein [Anaerolineales bacterium]|jgi:TorA maturation chaperone TorD